MRLPYISGMVLCPRRSRAIRSSVPSLAVFNIICQHLCEWDLKAPVKVEVDAREEYRSHHHKEVKAVQKVGLKFA